MLIVVGHTSPLRKSDPPLLTRTDSLCAQVNVGEAEFATIRCALELADPASEGTLFQCDHIPIEHRCLSAQRLLLRGRARARRAAFEPGVMSLGALLALALSDQARMHGNLLLVAKDQDLLEAFAYRHLFPDQAVSRWSPPGTRLVLGR